MFLRLELDGTQPHHWLPRVNVDLNDSNTMTPPRLVIRKFAQVSEIDLSFADLTVLVGAQGTGKSLALQWLKTAIDGKQIVTSLHEAGYETTNPENLIDLIFGVGMGPAWHADSAVVFDGNTITPSILSACGRGHERAFFIPAHRSLLISDGWAAPFRKMTADTPVVARVFSQNLFDLFSPQASRTLFPRKRILKAEYRQLIDRAVFHGGTVGIEVDQNRARRLKLTHGDISLPFMSWTAGQREFLPLLLGLYHLLPPRGILKRPEIDWVIIEEPEMGLHPEAITVFLLLALDLLWRGYRVVLSTHSPHILTAVWMLKRLQVHRASAGLMCRGFGVEPSQAMEKVARAALKKTYAVHLCEFGRDRKVRSKDISDLDPEADDERESGWGGLTGFSSRFGDAVRDAVNEVKG